MTTGEYRITLYMSFCTKASPKTSRLNLFWRVRIVIRVSTLYRYYSYRADDYTYYQSGKTPLQPMRV